MAQPNLKEILEISELNDKIDKFKSLIANSEIELESLKIFYENQENVEKQKIRDDFIQKKALQELQIKIEEYRSLEIGEKISTFQVFSDVFDKYISSKNMKDVVEQVIEMCKGEDEDISIVSNKSFAHLLEDNRQYSITAKNELRISTFTKEYILDPEYLKKICFDRLLISFYSDK